ncbi:MAG: toll/interleukin-1 receptor domain-containing protein [Methyloligellaceae bacterium]
MAPKVFISYRRDDSPGSAGRLYDRLAQSLPTKNLFMDVDAMVPGVDFVQEINRAVLGCDVLLAIIGRGWLSAEDKDGQRRLDNPGDFVRIEVATALENDIRVVPVLVDGAVMPPSDELPDVLQPLARRHAVELSHMRFAADTERLARALARSPDQAAPDAPPAHAEPGPDAEVEIAAAPSNRQALSRPRTFGAMATIFAIISSSAIAGQFAEAGTNYWLERIGPALTLWVCANAMIGPALSLKLWLPRLTMPHFWGVVGATFAALAAMIGIRQVLGAVFQAYLAETPAGPTDMILTLGLRELPECLVAGITLGYFLSQALKGWFPANGGRGFERRMTLLWMATGTAYAIGTFLVIAIAEAAVVKTGGQEAALVARAEARMWADTVVYGLSWALGFLLTFRFAPRGTP